jgi:peptidoglycan/xylan/chitin deacetylase (PgdA/CDA1 family)
MIAFKRIFCVVTAMTVTGLGTFFANLKKHLRPQSPVAVVTTQPPTTAEPYIRPDGVHEAPDGRGKLIALTFDDGPGGAVTNHILDSLQKANGASTFFCLGDRAQEYQKMLRKIVAQGSEVASHSYAHERLTRLSAEELEQNLSETYDALEEYSGKAPKLLRPPYGSVDGDMLSHTDAPVILWSIDSEDWRFCELLCKDRSDEEWNRDFLRVVNSVLDYVQDGDIVLMHDLYSFTQDVADAVIAELHHKGWKLVTVSALFDAKGVDPQPGEVYHCAR